MNYISQPRTEKQLAAYLLDLKEQYLDMLITKKEMITATKKAKAGLQEFIERKIGFKF